MSLGISVKTLRRWDTAGRLHVARTAGNHRRIGMAEIQRLQRQGEQSVCGVLYVRASTGLQAQESNRARQLERLRVAAAEQEYQVVQTIAAYTSSLNEQRRGMQHLLSLVAQQAVDVVLLKYPDRLVLFGFSSLQEAFRWQQVRLEVLDPPEQVDPTTDLLATLLTIVIVLCGERYTSRVHAHPRRKQVLPMLVSKSEQEERAA